jgi:hypothetical protein
VTHAVHVRVDDADSHHDFARHHRTFSQSIADVDPATWGGVAIKRTSGLRARE